MATYNVTNATELSSAIAKAVGGDKILVADGEYGKVNVTNRKYASEVTIQAASTASSPHFDGLFVHGSTNITFRGLELGRALGAGEPDYTQINYVRESSNIKLLDLDIHGSLDGNPSNDGIGLTVSNVTGLNVSNTIFREFYRGMQVLSNTKATIQNNDFDAMRSDGIIVVATDGIVIDGNRFTDFRPKSPDHADAIQFFNTGQTKGSQNITIKNNVQMQNYWDGQPDTGVQGIFIADPMAFGYKNVLIENNLMYSSNAWNGITISGGQGVRIIGNTVMSKPNDTKQFWIHANNSDSVVIADNFTDNITMKNVTKLFQSHNMNLALTPAARAEVLAINDATSALDLVVQNYGYQAPKPVVAAPVSSAVGNSLAGMFSSARSTAIAKVAVADLGNILSDDDASGTLDLGGFSSSAIVAAKPVPVAATSASVAPLAPVAIEMGHWSEPTHHARFEHFAAMA